MATVPAPHSWTAGDNALSSYLQSMTDSELWALGLARTGGKRPLAVMRQTVAQSIPNGAWTSVLLDTVDVDYDAGHSTTYTSRYVANTAGWYFAAGVASFAGNATGVRLAALAVNGTEQPGTVSMVSVSASYTSALATSRLLYLNVNDYLEVHAYQTSGAALNTSTAAAGQVSELSVRWVSS